MWASFGKGVLLVAALRRLSRLVRDVAPWPHGDRDDGGEAPGGSPPAHAQPAAEGAGGAFDAAGEVEKRPQAAGISGYRNRTGGSSCSTIDAGLQRR